MNKTWSRQEPEPASRAISEGCTFRPRIRTGIAGRPNLQLTGLAFTRNALLKKVSPEPAHKPGNTVRTAVHREWCVLHRCAAHIAPAAQLYICSDTGCTAVRVGPSEVYTCTEGVISPVQLYGLYGTVCTRVHVVYSKSYAFIAP